MPSGLFLLSWRVLARSAKPFVSGLGHKASRGVGFLDRLQLDRQTIWSFWTSKPFHAAIFIERPEHDWDRYLSVLIGVGPVFKAPVSCRRDLNNLRLLVFHRGLSVSWDLLAQVVGPGCLLELALLCGLGYRAHIDGIDIDRIWPEMRVRDRFPRVPTPRQHQAALMVVCSGVAQGQHDLSVGAPFQTL